MGRHPEGFGRVAATTARQVMLQRFRDAENEKIYGEFAAREGDIVAGVIQQNARANALGEVVLRMGSETKFSEGVIPSSEQVPGEKYDHGDRLRCYVLGVTRGIREPKIRLSRTHPNLVRKLFALEVPEIAEARWRSSPSPARPGTAQDRRRLQGVGTQRQGRLHRADGAAGAQRHA
jgi:N utilization substance protein A